MVEFHGSPTASIGMEWELQLLHPETLMLVDGILPLLEQYPQHQFIQPEFNQAMVEIASDVCANVVALEANITQMLKKLQSSCDQLGMKLCAAGTHPCCDRPGLVTPLPRYLTQQKDSGYLAGLMMTFALHIHVGVASGNAAIALITRLRPYLPILLALSASSPFWWSNDTGFASYRQRFLASLRTYGLPPSFENWQEFSQFFSVTQATQTYHLIRDLHWDLRPQPDLGTVEIRVMDAQPTIQESMMLAALVHSLAVTLLNPDADLAAWLRPQPTWIEKENYYQASRLGLDADYFKDRQGHHCLIRDLVPELLTAIAPVASALGELTYLQRLKQHLAEVPSYLRQRRVWQKTRSLRAVVQSLITELEAGLIPPMEMERDRRIA
ncbi:MAG: YbdK family carboxylate-amine ligase [Leptolyngbyaceae cyanobacterium]